MRKVATTESAPGARRPKPPRRVYRPVHGILLLDKPQGLSSNQALQTVRRLFKAEKGGHTGALDPLATGLLPICLGEATKIAGLLLSEDKAYFTRVQLGVETDTDDAEGRAIGHCHVPELTREAVESTLLSFIGRISQAPPRYSALKRDGEPLYRKARRGETFEVPEREVTIHAIALRDMGADWLELEVTCGSGTYIRSLARDLGRALGSCGHVAILRRLWVAPFRTPRMHTLDELEALAQSGPGCLEPLLLPIEAGLAHWRRLHLDARQEQSLRYGQVIEVDAPDGEVLACGEDGAAVALAEVSAGVLRTRRTFQRFQVQ